MSKSFFLLADVAEIDVDNIFEFTVSEFGIAKAIEYHKGLIHLFEQLTEFPQEGKSREEIKDGLRSIVYVSHVVFYRVLPTHIRIVRVLHQSQNVIDYFK